MADDVKTQDGAPQDKDAEILSLRREIKKLNRQITSMQMIFDSNRLITSAQSNLSAVISANRSQQEKYLEMLLACCPDIIMLFDQYGRFAYCTDAFLKTAGIKNFGLINGRTFKEVFSQFAAADFTDKFADSLEKASSENKTVTLDEMLTMSCQARTYTIQITSMRNEKGEVSGALALFHDLTDLLTAKEQAERASSAKSDFLATVSHEIRTPMNAIMGISDILKKTGLSKEQKDYLRNIENSSQMLLNLINDILDFSKIESGKFELINEYFDLRRLLMHLQSIFQVMFTQKHLKFVCEFDGNMPSVVLGDEKRVGQIITNLLNNALKYTNEGQVTFTASADTDGMFKFEIKDTGIGIKEEDRPRLFKAFEQFDKVKNKKAVGTGLGLAITKSITELMRGTVALSSVYGQGSVFTVKIPFETGERDDLRQEQAVDYAFSAARAKVLLVDDIDINLMVAEAMLEEYGIKPDTALNGALAVEKAAAKEYDIIFMDHMMPEMDGVEAAHKIRGLGGKNKEVPIIALTANAVTGAEDMFLANGFNGFLSKPMNKQLLAGCLIKWLPPELVDLD